ncbi:MAG: helix-turn-helix domain-containing protein, partial [Clostridia bacterium]|nr:helix-turn-helix domain-containing protein [Clostridia bacterium]
IIWEKFTEAIAQSKLTQAEIAKLIGVKETSLKNYLSGKTKLRLATFANLCNVLNLSAIELLRLAYREDTDEKSNAPIE